MSCEAGWRSPTTASKKVGASLRALRVLLYLFTVQHQGSYYTILIFSAAAVCDDDSEDRRRRESADSREDTGAKNDGDTSLKDEIEEQRDESSGRQRWKSTSGILASSEDDDFGIKNRHSSTPGRNAAAAPGSAPFLESLASGSGGGGNSVAEDHMARLRDAYSLFLTTSGMLVNMCKKNLGIDEEGVGVEASSVADNSGGGNCGEEDGGRKDTPDAAKE